MCGICGTTSAGDGSILARMNAALVHRGPDDEGTYVDPVSGLGLGARRLSIIDVEGGHQPLANEDGTVWAVLNGEIYNFAGLRERLARAGHTLATRTDTEVLVHLYEEYGNELVHALEGMYAFAVWDGRAQRLLLGRDRLGEKPLFYTERDRALTFASELTALLKGVGGTAELDPAAVDRYFTYGYVTGEDAIVAGVRQLRPGHLLVWDAATGSVEVRRYWSPPAAAPDGPVSADELVEETSVLLEQAVRSRLVADVPVGVFLSGGVDSTLVAAFAARHVSGTLKTFTVGYDSGAVDETGPARRSARLIGSDHNEYLLTQGEVQARVPGLLAAVDQPLADQAYVALRILTEAARATIKVAVGGEGADEVFGGYPRYRWLHRSAMLDGRVPRWAAQGTVSLLERLPLGRAARLRDVVRPAPLTQRHVDWVTDGRRSYRSRVYGPRLREYEVGPIPEPAHVVLDGDVAGFMRLDQLQWLPDDVLAKADRASMQASLELRTPFLSRDLVEFAATVPARVHIAGGGKLLLRRVLRAALPEAAHTRAKVAFRTPARDWLRGPLAAALDDQLSSSALYEQGWFERDQVRRLVDEHRGGRDRSSVLWPVFAFGVWLDRFVRT